MDLAFSALACGRERNDCCLQSVQLHLRHSLSSFKAKITKLNCVVITTQKPFIVMERMQTNRATLKKESHECFITILDSFDLIC